MNDKENFFMLKYSLLILWLSASSFFSPEIIPKNIATPILHVVVSGINDKAGSVRVAIYDRAENFLQIKKYTYNKSLPAGNNTSLQFDFSIPNGDYAVTSYHDLNDDHHLDQNYLGVPTEPYALSNNVNVKWRRPTFYETKIAFNLPEQTVYLQLKKWKER